MLSPRFLLFGVLLLKFSYEVSAMDCSVGGLVISCPTVFEDSDKIFCCQSSVSSSIQVCCNAEDYLKQNGAILAGIVIGALVLLVICTLCCCCFCSCCFLAKRRQRGTVLYGPLSGAQILSTSPPPSSSYPVVHPFPPSQFSNPPPPYQPTTVPNYNYSEQQQQPKNTYFNQ